MGTYLSTPVLDKCYEDGEELTPQQPVSWGVVDMQGWRKTMEDAHIAQSILDDKKPNSNSTNISNNDNTTNDSSIIPTRVFAVFDGHGGCEVARFCQLYLVDVLTRQEHWVGEEVDFGQALIETFHELDRMIDDPLRKSEIDLLREYKPAPGETRNAITTNDTQNATTIPTSMNDEKNQNNSTNITQTVNKIECDVEHDEEKKELSPSENNNEPPPYDSSSETTTTAETIILNDDNHDSDTLSNETNDDDDSDAVIGEIENDDRLDSLQEDGTNNHEDNNNNNDDDDKVEDDENSSSSQFDPPMALFKRILNMSRQENKPLTATFQVGCGSGKSSRNDETASDADQPFSASIMQNGRKICNLPDHPVHAGCTAICAVMHGSTLTVANAGDSRAVLCRAGGITEALSLDHKPNDEIEMNRIENAGGFVTMFGRVNGNLNLSRSIGDLKYKQVPGIKASEQMITAEPDIKQVTLHPDDEFIILACDGIWDCLTNEEAVLFVRERIDTQTPRDIGMIMLDSIISVDPRQTQGIGGDNMTVMIIDLQPTKRRYRMNDN